ncbi:MAG TPA: acetyl-CoA carboxylase biotin carboxylase subunit [Pirellulales bacterium]
MFKRILIANRGEIALRIIRACRELGVETVAVFSEADRGAEYLKFADQAFCVGPAKGTDSYLKIAQIISAAEVGNVEAIHPGYGFLAENAHFAEVCRDCNIEFIGPHHSAMIALGDKNSSKTIARKANVPLVPGSNGLVETEEEALRIAREIGFPVLIKATAGGGGRGMRIASNDLSLSSAYSQAKAEAQAAFGNDGVFIEKLIEHPRHVEVQLLGDTHGNVVHLHERDCTIQRRHQKLIEESPSPSISEKTRQAICESAVRLAKAAGYYNAGTCEFLVDKNENFYFIEVNARIQVEHPVTEMVTGVDLIQMQIRVASGEALPFQQADIKPQGHAIECRINAEDPKRKFQPCPGKIESMFWPGGPGVRFDSHIHPGYVVPPYYDSMVGKLIVHRPTRREAIKVMLRALSELQIKGIPTTIPILRDVLSHSAFHDGQVDTTFLERTWQ